MIPVAKVKDWQRLLRAMRGQVSEHMRACQGKTDVLFTLENMVDGMEALVAPVETKCEMSYCAHAAATNDFLCAAHRAEMDERFPKVYGVE